jgi:type II secretory pathway component HofQ
VRRIPLFLAVSIIAAAGDRAGAQSAVLLKPLPAIQLEGTQVVPGLDGPRFSLGFSQPTPIRDVLLLLVRDTRLSVVLDPSLNQRFIGDLKNVTLRDALDLIVEPLGLDYSVRGQVIRVFPRELETRLYNIDHVITQRTSSRSIGGAIGVNSTDAPDVFADLAEGVRTQLSSEGRMSIDRTAALLQVIDRPSRLARVEQYIEMAMLRVMRQVQIDATIVEIELGDDASSGIDWKRVLGALPQREPASPTPNGVTLTIAASSVDALLTALRAQGTVTSLSNPMMMTMNNEPAVVRIADAAVPSAAVALSITPQISAEGVIHMSVSASVAGQSVVREADSVFRIRQGETVVIAGLMHGRANGSEPGRRRTDVVILLTPTILQARTAG